MNVNNQIVHNIIVAHRCSHFSWVSGGWVTGPPNYYSHAICETGTGASRPDTVSVYPKLFLMKTYILLIALFSKAYIPFMRTKVGELIHAMVHSSEINSKSGF